MEHAEPSEPSNARIRQEASGQSTVTDSSHRKDMDASVTFEKSEEQCFVRSCN